MNIPGKIAFVLALLLFVTACGGSSDDPPIVDPVPTACRLGDSKIGDCTL